MLETYVSAKYYCFPSCPPDVNDMPQAYCVKCKTSVEIKNPQNVTLKNGKAAIKGICPNCGTSVFRIGKA
jgi:RNase P subunit RPR2